MQDHQLRANADKRALFRGHARGASMHTSMPASPRSLFQLYSTRPILKVSQTDIATGEWLDSLKVVN